MRTVLALESLDELEAVAIVQHQSGFVKGQAFRSGVGSYEKLLVAGLEGSLGTLLPIVGDSKKDRACDLQYTQTVYGVKTLADTETYFLSLPLHWSKRTSAPSEWYAAMAVAQPIRQGLPTSSR